MLARLRYIFLIFPLCLSLFVWSGFNLVRDFTSKDQRYKFKKDYTIFETYRIEESYYTYDFLRIEFFHFNSKNEDLEKGKCVIKKEYHTKDYQNDIFRDDYYYIVISGIKSHVSFENPYSEMYGYGFDYKDLDGRYHWANFYYVGHWYISFNAFGENYLLFERT